MQYTEHWLTAQPRNPQARFLQGVAQSRQGKTAEALDTFTGLTRDFPELPEPHNNLAVLLAAQGQLTEARNALEMAVRLHPSYATAHRNLGDIYLQQAAQSYRTALQLNPQAPGLAQRLQAVESLPAPAVP